MNGLAIAGKAFVVCEDIRQVAEQNKGKTVAEYLKEQREARLERAVARQFGMTVEAFRGRWR